jgi:hypothetical protein
MGTESGQPFVAGIVAFAVLVVALAFAAQRKPLIYRGIVSVVAVVATLMTTLSYMQLASARSPALIAAHAEPISGRVLAPQTTCIRQGVVPACNCIGQR